MNETLLAELVAAEAGVSRKMAKRIIRAMADVIARTVAAGESVNVNNFGTWLPVDAGPRRARNPQTMETVDVPARRTVRVRVAPRLQQIVRTGEVVTTAKRPKSR